MSHAKTVNELTGMFYDGARQRGAVKAFERNGSNRDHEPTKAERRLQQALALYTWLETEQRRAWQAEDMTWYALFDQARRDMWQVLAWWEEAVEVGQGAMRWSGYYKPAA